MQATPTCVAVVVVRSLKQQLLYRSRISRKSTRIQATAAPPKPTDAQRSSGQAPEAHGVKMRYLEPHSSAAAPANSKSSVAHGRSAKAKPALASGVQPRTTGVATVSTPSSQQRQQRQAASRPVLRVFPSSPAQRDTVSNSATSNAVSALASQADVAEDMADQGTPIEPAHLGLYAVIARVQSQLI